MVQPCASSLLRMVEDDAMRRPAVSLVVLLGMLAGVSARSADQSIGGSAPTITVSGSGEVVLDPDRATVTLSVDSEGPSSAAAAANNARVTTAVTNALLATGAARSDLLTANYMVQPHWQYSNNQPPSRVGYEAHNTLRISVTQLPMLGKWIDVALGAGATRIESVEFDSSAVASARREALSKAVAHAQEDAETLAKAAGGKLGPLQDLTSAQQPTPFRPVARLAVPAPISPEEQTHLEPSPLHISAVVTARWLFEP